MWAMWARIVELERRVERLTRIIEQLQAQNRQAVQEIRQAKG